MTKTLYVRFGDAPANGLSWNDEHEKHEAGMSCYRAEWQGNDHDTLCITIPNDYCVFTLNQVRDRPLYAVTGNMVGRGGNGEPLLANATLTPISGVEEITWCVDPEEC